MSCAWLGSPMSCAWAFGRAHVAVSFGLAPLACACFSICVRVKLSELMRLSYLSRWACWACLFHTTRMSMRHVGMGVGVAPCVQLSSFHRGKGEP
jgi:hypothetical protein